MTEVQVEYLTQNTVDKYHHRCPRCYRLFGYENDEGQIVMGNLVLSYLDGFCACCGHPYYYRSTDAQMEKILARAKSRAAPSPSG